MKNIHAKYKLFMLIPLFALVGCNNENKCVVKQVSDNKIYVDDIDTGETKVLVMNTRYDHLMYVYPNDTITFFADKRGGERFYKDNEVIQIPDNGHLLLDSDTLNHRQYRRFYKNTR